MARLRPRTASVGNRSDILERTPPLGIVPLRPSPAPATIVQNLAASLIGNIQEDIRCACHIEKSLYTGDNQGTIMKWNISDASRATFYDGLGAPVNVVVGVNKNKDIWAGLASGNITILNLETKSAKSQVIHAHDAAVNCIAAGIQCAWSGGDDFLIKKWDLDGVELFTYNHHHGFIKDLLVLRNDSADSHIRLWGASSDDTISVAALQDNQAQHTLLSDTKLLSVHSKGVSALCLVSTDAIWSGYEDGSIVVWSSLGVLRNQVQQGHKGPVVSFAVMGAHVWSGSGDHTVLVWESSTCQLLFSLGDHGGFVKSMVRVEYMCWVFASGKNVRIWCAQSVWDTYEGEKDRLNRTVQKLKENLEKAQRDKQSLENAGKKSQQDLETTKQQLQEQRSTGQSAQEKSSAEIEKLKIELAKTLGDLEATKKNAQKDSGSLDEEIQTLLEKLRKLEAEKDAAEKAAKAKVQGLEKNLEELRMGHKKTLEDLEALKAELSLAQADLETSRKQGEDLLAEQNLDNQRAAELERSLMAANDKNQELQNDLARSMKDKEDATKAGSSAQADFVSERAELEGRIKQLQEDLDKAHENVNANITAKDAEMQKLQGELKKKAKELKKVLKDAGEDTKRSAKEVDELKQVIEQLKKSQDASSSAEVTNNENMAKLASELQNTRDDLQKALSDKEERDTALEKMKEDHLKEINYLKQERDEAKQYSVGLREKLQELEQNINQLKDAAATNDALVKERDELLRMLGDAESEIQNLKGEILQVSQSADSQTSALEELRDAGEKGLKDLQESEQKRADLEKSIKQLEEMLAQASAELEKTTADKVSREDSTAQISRDLHQLMKAKAALEEQLANKAAELERVSQALDKIKKDKASVEQELNEIRNHKAITEAELNQKMTELEQAKSSQQDNIIKLSKDIEELKAQKALLEDKMAASLREVEELKKARRSQEEVATQKAAEFDQMVREMERLRFEIKQKEDEYRLVKESATFVAADAGRRIEVLQNEIARLEMKLENAVMQAKAALTVDDPVWARIRELETSLMQAHMDYRLLNQDVRRMRKKRGRYRDNQALTPGVSQGDGLDVALKVMQPGFNLDYTKLKVSSAGSEPRVVKNIQVYGQNSNQPTPRRIISITAPPPQTDTKVVPIRAPSPSPEMIEPVVSPRPQSAEKERYFPSHGPLRVRRGLSPGRALP